MSLENQKLAECLGVKAVMAPVDLNTAAVTGARISLKEGYKVAVVFNLGSSTGATVEFTLKQHTAASGGTSANLSVDNVYYKKVGAATKFTKVEPSSAAAVYDLSSDFGGAAGQVVFEVDGSQFSEGYTHFSVDIADSAAAKIGSGLYFLSVKNEPAYSIDL